MLKGQRPSLLHGSRVTNRITSCSARLERLEEEPGVVLTILLRLVPGALEHVRDGPIGLLAFVEHEEVDLLPVDGSTRVLVGLRDRATVGNCC